MSLDLAFFDGKDIEEAATISFTTDGFKELIGTGVFKLGHCTTDSGHRAIDLRIFRVKVAEHVESLKIFHPQKRELLKLIADSKYMATNP